MVRLGTDPSSSKYLQVTVKHPESVIVWGAFRYHGTKKLAVLPRNVTVNEDCFLKLLTESSENCFGHCQSNVFRQDGAPAHISELIKGWLEWVGIDYIKDWPWNSPSTTSGGS